MLATALSILYHTQHRLDTGRTNFSVAHSCINDLELSNSEVGILFGSVRMYFEGAVCPLCALRPIAMTHGLKE